MTWQRAISKIFKVVFGLAGIGAAALIVLGLVWYLDHIPYQYTVRNDQMRPILARSFLAKAIVPFFSRVLPQEPFLAGERDDRINFLLLGVPGPPYPAANLTDTIIVGSFQPSTQKLALVSIPRDFYVKHPSRNLWTKINSLYLWAKLQRLESPVKLIIAKISQITALPIHYWALADLQGLAEIVDQLGGLDIWLENDIYDPYFPGPHYTFQTFSLKKGFHHLDGKTTIKLVRSRHSQWGDFDRIKIQRQTLFALVRKAKEMLPEWSVADFWSLFQKVTKHLQTNFTLSELKRAYTWGQTLSGKRIFETSLDPLTTGLVRATHLPIGEKPAYVLIPEAGLENYENIQDFFKNIFNKF